MTRRAWLTLLAAAAWSASALGAGFSIGATETRLVDDVYLLDARIDYDLSDASIEALDNGVPLTLELEIEVKRRRDWRWDETIAALAQRYRVEYHALARQYLVTNLNSGVLRSFHTRFGATDWLGLVQGLPLLDSSLLKSGGDYYVRLRAGLDVEALPAPLRPQAYLSPSWRMDSEWAEWPL